MSNTNLIQLTHIVTPIHAQELVPALMRLVLHTLTLVRQHVLERGITQQPSVLQVAHQQSPL